MPAPPHVPPLPVLPGVPASLHRLAEIYVTRATSPDHLFLLAEACYELVPNLPMRKARAIQELGHELRRRAPGYA